MPPTTSPRTRGFGALLAAACAAAPGPARAADAPRPNVLVVVADDLGSGDVGCYGCKDIPTPNIDGLAAGGVRLTAGYVSAPVCSPTRAGLMTGRYQTRFGHEFNHPLADRGPVGLPLNETLFPQYLGAAGYATGHVGKWHLGNPTMKGFAAHERGFAESAWFGGAKKAAPVRLARNGTPATADAYSTDAMAAEASAFVARHRGTPWFLYLAFTAPHEPLDVPDAWVEPFAKIGGPKRPRLAALVAALDRAVGKVLAALRETGQDGRTLVVFLSDNGSYPSSGGSNGPFRGSKGTTFEGGVRVPFVLRWPGTLPAGAVYDRPASALDVLPTALAAAGVAAKPSWKLDGVDLVPFLTGKAAGDPHPALFWRYGAQSAVRRGDWKLVRAGETPAERANPPARLVNLAADPGEATDLSAKEPARAAELAALWGRWNAEQAEPLWGGGKP